MCCIHQSLVCGFKRSISQEAMQQTWHSLASFELVEAAASARQREKNIQNGMKIYETACRHVHPDSCEQVELFSKANFLFLGVGGCASLSFLSIIA